MEELIEQLQQTYFNEIANIKAVGKAEICITVADGSNAEHFSQELQDHLVATIDELDIIKINIVDSQGTVRDSFATNQ
jgi:hypothetical protein